MTITTPAADTATVSTAEKKPKRAGTSHGPAAGLDPALVTQLVAQAREQGLQLSGEGGLLQQLTKIVLESALDGELTDHLGYDKHDPAGANSGNSRNGTRTKTVLTDVGPVEVTVPRDRAGTFEPQIVRKHQRRLSGVEDLVLSAKGLTHGEISAHLAEVYGAEVYGAEVPKQTISTITDKDANVERPASMHSSATTPSKSIRTIRHVIARRALTPRRSDWLRSGNSAGQSTV